MTTDYPDWSRLVQVIGSNIMIPIDVQASYIMMPIDIQGQYVTLEIDIVAQTVGNINVDIAAMTVGTIDIDITAQTVGDLDINIDAQNIGVQLQPDWQAMGGKSKGYGITGSNMGEGGSATYDYEVPAGKVVYVTDAVGRWSANVEAERDLNQICSMGAAGQVIGGNGGAQLQLATPYKVTAGNDVHLGFANRTAHHVDYYVLWRGYEIDA